jgi:endoglucanase
VHFLSGMNPGAVNYLTDDTERTYVDVGENGVLNDPEAVSLLIFMLSVLEQ